MNQLQTFKDFLTTSSVQIPVLAFVLNLLAAAVLAALLGRIYTRYGRSLSNRKQLAGNFVLITMTTMLIIAIVKSSLALSLGLVGALSIVRFRAAIKEPEELGFLFLSIAIGLGFGADQAVITTIAFVIICAFLIIGKRFVYKKGGDNQNLFLTVSGEKTGKMELETVVDILKTHCTDVNLKRFDESKDQMEAAFLVEFTAFDQLKEAKKALQAADESVKISFLDNKGVL